MGEVDRKNLEVEEDKNIAAVEVVGVVAVVGAVLKEGNGNSDWDSLDCNFDHNVVVVAGVEEGFDFAVVEEGMA